MIVNVLYCVVILVFIVQGGKMIIDDLRITIDVINIYREYHVEKVTMIYFCIHSFIGLILEVVLIGMLFKYIKYI